MSLGDRLRRLIGRPRLVVPDDLAAPPALGPGPSDARADAERWLAALAGKLAGADAAALATLDGPELDRHIAALSDGDGGTGRLAAEWLDKLAVATPLPDGSRARDRLRARAVEIYLARGEGAAAAAHLEALVDSDEHGARAHFLLGEHHQRQGDRARALRHFEAVLARDLTYPNARARAEILRAALGAGPRPHAPGATLAGVEGQATAAGRYRLVAELGRGATGAVYRARDTQLERDVAVKLLHAHLGGRGTLARFFAEARVAAALRHPSIVAVLDLDEEHRRIVMELLAGGTLRERLLSGPLPLGETLARHVEILSALVAAHRRGVVHRDLKPGNLLFRRDPALAATEIVLCDFGSAHLGDATLGATTEAAAVGTLRYMAPEQRRGVASAAGDVYAAGVILHEMLSGRATVGLTHVVPDDGLALEGVPPAVAEHLAALTRADPARRPSGEEALARARALAQSEASVAAMPAS